MPFLQLSLDIGKRDPEPFEDAMFAAGASAVTLQDSADDPILEPAPGATPLWPTVTVVALFPGASIADEIIAAVTAELGELPAYRFETIEDRAWEREWLKDFKPMLFGKRLWICPGGMLPPEIEDSRSHAAARVSLDASSKTLNVSSNQTNAQPRMAEPDSTTGSRSARRGEDLNDSQNEAGSQSLSPPRHLALSPAKRIQSTSLPRQLAPSLCLIHLDPGLAFGTGTHPTTAMCLEWLDGADVTGKTVIDYGCGSGILAIAALKLGARSAIGLDIDDQALTASRDNAVRNQVSELLTLQPASDPLPAADIVLANILAGPLHELAPRLADAVTPNGRLVLSGILKEQASGLAQRYAAWFDMEKATFKGDWARLVGRKRG